MKKINLLFIFLLMFSGIYAQTVVFNEDFEALPLEVISSGTPGWERSTKFKNSGNFSDSSQVAASSTSYLTTNSFSTTSNTYVVLEFAQICKIDFFDNAEIEVSVDNGSTWTKLTGSQYLGTGQFGNIGDKFTATSYPIWDPTNATTIPQNAWWQTEKFNISSIAGNQADVMVRFKLSDGGTIGNGGNYGWLIDDIKVTVQPFLNNLVLKNIIAPEGDECYNGSEPVSIIIGNIGTDPVTTPFTASYKLGNASPVNETVNTTIASGDSITYTFTTPINFVLQGADSTMYLKTYVNMAADPFQTNDTLGKDIKFLYTPPSPLADHDTIVYGTTATVGAISNSNLNWYASPISTVLLDTGSTYTTPVLYGNTAYYVSASAGTGTAFVGPIDNTIGGGGATSLTTYFTIFDVLSTSGVTIKNVDIYPGVAAGAAFTMVVQDAALQTIATYSGVTTVASGAKQTVNVNFDVPYGNNYRIGFTTMPSLYRNTAGATFPYTLPGIISITGQTFSGYPQYYYYVYNWEVGSGSGCESPRTEVWAITTGNPPVDAGVVSIDQPLSPTNLQPQDAYVTIQNFGTNPLTSVTINWTNNGIAQTPHPWNGTLASSQTVSVNIGSFTPELGNNNIVAWTTNPNGVTDPMPLNDSTSAVINAFEPLNGIYTIGGVNPNFPDFSSVEYALTNYGVVGPVTFILAADTFFSRMVFTGLIPGATDINTVTFKGTAGTVIHHSTTVSGDRAAILIDGTKYLRFDSLTINIPDSSTYGYGFSILSESEDIEITNCTINTVATSTSSNYGGIIVSGSLTSYSTSSTGIKDIYIAGNTINGGYLSIGVRGTTTVYMPAVVIENNTMANAYYYGLYTYYLEAPVFTDNTIDIRSSGTTTTSGYGIYFNSCDGPLTVLRNTLTNPGSYGLYFSTCNSTSGNNSMVANNMIGGGFRYTSTGYGIYMTSTSYLDLYYNSVNYDATLGRAFYTSTTVNNINSKNNTFVFSNSGAGYAAYISSTTTFTENDYNNYYSTGSNFVYYGTAMADLAALQAVGVPTGNDAHSIVGDPIYVTPTLLYTFDSHLYQKGTPITTVTDDIDGNARSATTPCIGATEFTPASVDASLEGISEPPASGCSLTSTEDVSFLVKNYGISAITSINATYILDGGTPVVETFSTNILPDSTRSLTFATPVNLSAQGIYNLDLYIHLTNDGNGLNDTIFNYEIRHNNDINSGNYTMGFEDGEYYDDWTVIDVNEDGRTWEVPYNSTTYANTGSKSARFYNSTTNTGGDYLFSRCFSLEQGKTYEIEFFYRAYSTSYVQSIDLHLATDVSVSAIIDTLASYPVILNTTYENSTTSFTVPNDGVYYFVWRAYSPGNNYYAYIDDINIRLIPDQEATLLSLLQPNAGCNLTTDTVSLAIVNTGSGIINGNMTASYQVTGNPTPVTENVTGSINPGDTLIFDFNTLVNLSTTQDSTFEFTAWIDLLNDPFTFNDSIIDQVESSITPNAPTGIPDTVNYGQPAELIASSNGNIIWYDDMISQSPIQTGDTLITPSLFATTTYYAEASGGGPGTIENVGITSAGTSSFITTAAGWGLVFTAIDEFVLDYVHVYPTGTGTITIHITDMANNILYSSLPFSLTGTGSEKIQVPVDITIPQGQYKIGMSYTGITNLVRESSGVSYPYTSPSNLVSITVGANGGTSTTTSAYYWFYDWGVRPPGGSCVSSRIPVEAYVNLPQYEAEAISFITPQDENCSDNADIVSIEITNNGSNTISSGLTASYTIEGGTPVTESVTDPVAPGDTIIFAFSAPVVLNLTTGDSTVDIRAYVSHVSDIYNVNDTIDIAAKYSYTPPSAIADHDTVPYGSSALVGAISNYDLYWYATPTGTTLLDTGATYSTPVLYGNTPYYVAASEGSGFAYVGMATSSGGTSGVGMNTYGLYFDALSAFTLKSVDVYPNATANNTPGDVTISVIDGSGNILHQAVVNVNGFIQSANPTPQTVDLNFDIQPANALRLVMSAKSSSLSGLMFQPTAGGPYPFPYTIPGIVSITSGTYTGSVFPSLYYYFYNWKVSSGSGCESPRTEVWAVVTGNPAVDAGVISVDQPVSPTNLQPQDAYVTIQNFGTDPLTSVTINWMNNGILQTPFNWGGSLATSQTAQINIGTFTPILGNNNLVAWTSNPNGVTDPMLLNDTASALIEAFEPLCGTYTIGGTNPNFATFADALYALENYGVACAVTFRVQPGFYPERIVLEAYNGVSATNTIRFVGEPGAIINFEPTVTGERAVILLDGVKHMQLDSLMIDIPATATYGFGIQMYNACDSIEITNCTVNTVNTATSSNFAGIVASNSLTSATSTGNNVSNLLLENNTINGGYYGITLVGTSSNYAGNIKVYNNTVEETYYQGIYLYYLLSPEVKGNVVDIRSTGTTSVSAYGIYSYYIDGPFYYTHNKIINSGAYGMYLYSSNSTTTPSIIANNMIGGGFRNLTSTTASGIYISSSSNIGIYHNSINMDAPKGSALYALSSAAILDIRNNSFAYTGNDEGYAYNIATPSNVTKSNYNNYYSNGSNFVKYGIDFADLAGLKSVNTPVGNDTSSLNGNPFYYSNTNLHALTTQMYQKGTPITGITDDFDYDVRSTTAPCIGADEFTPSNIDAAPVALYAPMSTCGLGNAETISVIVQNLGLNTITNLNLSYSVNGSTAVSQSFTVNMASSGKDTLSFTTTYNFSAPSTYNVFVTTQVTGDQVSFNDTMNFVINTGHDLYASAYTMGFEDNEDYSRWSVLDVNNNARTWEPGYSSSTYAHTGTYSARFYNITTNTGGDWLFTPCFYLEAGKSYKIEYYYRAYSVSYPQDIALMFGNDNTPLAMTDTLINMTGINNTSYQLASAIVNVTADDVYYFAWLAHTQQNSYYAYIDDINIRLLEAKDAAVTAINNIDPLLNGGDVLQPEVVITNLGSDTLTAIPVKYTINGGTPVTENWSGTLLPDSSVTYSFTTGFNVPNGDFTFCAYTQLSNDGNNANDTMCTDAFGIPLVTIPFADDFEGTMNFYPTGSTNEWQHGVPTASVINTAYSPVNVWATVLNGNHSANNNYNLYSPRFSFVNTTHVLLSFWHWIDSELDTDGGKIQYTTNNGNTWNTLGVINDPLGTNWYNSASINGTPAFSGQSGMWAQSTFDLSQFDNYPTPVQFRFNFFANGTVQNNGWALDNFELIRDDIPEDAGVIQINSPGSQMITGSSTPVEVVIENFGTDTLYTIPVRYRVNNNVPINEQWTGTLLPGSTTTFTFSAPLTETSTFDLCAYTRIVNDIYTFNDTTCMNVTIVPATYDAGVTQIVTPVSPTVIGQPTNVSVKVKNFGTDPLTSFDISYDINSGTPVVETWTGTLAPNAEITYDFTQTYVSPGGNYIFCAKTELTSDQNSTNDKICETITGSTGIDDIVEGGLILEQNIPNPATSRTIIGFTLPQTGTYVFTMRNTIGQIVYTENGKRSQGKYQIELNLNELPSSIYFYSLEFEGSLRVKKLIIN